MRRVPSELREFLAAYASPVPQLSLAARQAVLVAAPDSSELIYDAYNAVSVAFSFSDRLGDAFCHVAAYEGHVNLGFNRGSALDDPDGLLEGSGARIRHIRLTAAKDLKVAGVARLLQAAASEGRSRATSIVTPPQTIVKPSTGKKRRPGA